ncbi:MAG: MgtC/SapB family protein, partial [Patescibacteria group bacterium]
IGLEREYRHKPAGFRTYLLVSLGSALFTILSRQLLNFAGGPGIDPTRIAAQVVTGIGFIGAGVIFRHEGKTEGITTAAGLWVAAAIGMAVASNYYFIAIVSAFIVVILFPISRKLISLFFKKEDAEKEM